MINRLSVIKHTLKLLCALSPEPRALSPVP